MKPANEILENLPYFTGTSQWYKNPLFTNFTYTDGIKYLTDYFYPQNIKAMSKKNPKIKYRIEWSSGKIGYLEIPSDSRRSFKYHFNRKYGSYMRKYVKSIQAL
jgi:hypothetical protein